MADPLEPGDPDRLGEYWLAGRLGAGGQGVVYDAYGRDGDRVAVKVFHVREEMPGDFARLTREVEAARRVASFCTARILRVQLEGARPYIVSEYVEGRSLGRAVRDGHRFSGDDLHRLAVGIATALTAVHEAGVIHRDLKPDNVLLGPDGPRVIDFGIARTQDMSVTPGPAAGTPLYMAPEVFLGDHGSAAGDVFAWGAIMYFAAAGEHAFRAGSMPAVMHRILTARPDLTVLPETLRPLVAACLDKDPLARPAARTLLSALTRAPVGDAGELLAAGATEAGLLARWEPIDPGLGRVAEAAFTALEPGDREVVPDLFARLVSVDEDGGVASRRVPLAEVSGLAGLDRILTAFAPLVARSEGHVVLCRPAVLRAWPRLRGWLEHDRVGLPGHQRIRHAAQEWNRHGRHMSEVLSGARLQEALLWAAGHRRPGLNELEQAFLKAGMRAQIRGIRRRRAMLAVLAVLSALAVVAALLAAWAAENADRSAAEARRQRDQAVSRRLAAQSIQLTTDPATSAMLAAAAWRISPTPEARAAALTVYARPDRAVLTGRSAEVGAVAVSPDGRMLATGSADKTVRLWDIVTRSPLGSPLTGHRKTITFIVFSPDSRMLATAGGDHTVRLWDVTTHRQLGDPLPAPGDVRPAVACTPDGRTLVTAAADGVHAWDVSTSHPASRESADSPSARTDVLSPSQGKAPTRTRTSTTSRPPCCCGTSPAGGGSARHCGV